MLQKIKFNSPVILSFVFLSLIALILDFVTRGLTNRLFFSIYSSSLANPLTYVRLFGHVLGHAGWQHYINNMLLLLIVGPLLEEKYGSLNMIYIILITAVISGLANVLLFPGTALLGASGVVFAFILLSSITSFEDGTIPLTFLLVALIYIGGQIIEGLTVDNNISNSTHIIGGIVGTFCGYYLNRRKIATGRSDF